MKPLKTIGALLALLVAFPSDVAAVDSVRVLGATPDVVDRVEWAIGRFTAAGLDLPQIELSVHDDDRACEGADGVTHMTGRPVRIDLCNTHRLIILHGLAHAWDASSLNDATRGALMEETGIDVWNDRSVPWKDRGVECLAEIMVWGLHETGRPDEARRAAYRLLTGSEPLWSLRTQ